MRAKEDGGWGELRMWLPQLWVPDADSRWDCDGIQAGCLQGQLSLALAEPTEASLQSSLLFLTGCLCCLGLN